MSKDAKLKISINDQGRGIHVAIHSRFEYFKNILINI